MADRYSEDRFFGPEDQYQVSGPPRARTASHSSARDYAAAGVDIGQGRDRGFRDTRYDRGQDFDYRPARSGRDHGYGGREHGERGERGFFERAGDEVRSWFGDTEAERRRERDMRYDERFARGHDREYGAWRRERIDELDRDYDEYRRENAQRFHNEFSTWRSDRQGQRDCLDRVAEHMEVVGSDGSHVGKVDKVRGDRIVLTKSDANAGGHHHSIPSRWIDSVDDKVTLRKTAAEAQAAWKDEERAGAFFGNERDDSRDWRGDHNLDRSFRGTY
ncbi:MAG: DUF2171 domain-containing protein [Sphingomonas sp.]|uniref:DUF2171 domain-containing protein n=1 Tax=Sphingomonas sp. TaxID=28214 RepID=UPI0025F3E388|nr:DUF2171 domain-containing protein [Sphingomonas sp.]MBX3566131.1 DUF2171 domain-containing protein [Sphingomonas sp.]